MTRAELIAAMDVCVGSSRLLSELPAVATLDWADLAAQSVAVLAEDALSAVFIGSLGDGDAVTDIETIGVAWGGATGRLKRSCRAIENRRSEPRLAAEQLGASGDPAYDARAGQPATRVRSRQEIENTELTLRSRLERLTALDVAFDAGALFPGVVAVIEPGATRSSRQPDGAGFPRGGGLGLASILSGVAVDRAAVGVMGLSAEAPNRFIAAIVGFPADEKSWAVSPNMRDAVVTSALRVLMPELTSKAATAIGTTPATSSRWLTAREQQVLRLLSIGLSVREIADELGRSPHTVHDHVKSLHRKLGASSRGELVARALGFSTETESSLDQVELPTLLGPDAIESDDKPVIEVATRPEAISSSTVGRATLPMRPASDSDPMASRPVGRSDESPEINVSLGRSGDSAGVPVQRGETRARPLRPHG